MVSTPSARSSTNPSVVAERPASPRIFKVAFGVPTRRNKGRFTTSTVSVFIKVPYGALMMTTEMLTRAMTTGQIVWFRIDVAKPSEITKDVREHLTRWTDVLARTTEITAVDWSK